jgi:hypothetical protein
MFSTKISFSNVSRLHSLRHQQRLVKLLQQQLALLQMLFFFYEVATNQCDVNVLCC